MSERERSLTGVLLRNILSNWAGFAVQAATALVLTPFVLRSLGQELYGIWALVSSVTGYYGLLDLGFRAGLTQYLTRHLSRDDYHELNRTASTGFYLLAGLGVISLLAGLGTAVVLPHFVHVEPALVRRTQIAVAVVAVGFAAQFAFFTFTSLLTSLQRFDVSNAIGITTRLGTALAIWLVLRHGGGIVALSVITTGSLLADYAARAAVALHLVPRLRIRPALIGLDTAKQFLGYGVWTSLVQAGVRLISYSDALVIGVVLTAEAITPFAIAVSLITYFSDLLVPITQVFFPVFTKFDAAGERDELRRVYLRCSTLMLHVGLALALVSTAMAHDFINTWIGPSVLGANRWGSAAVIFYVLVIGATVSGWQRLSIQLLLGMRLVRTTAWLFGLEAVSNLALSVVLGRRLGIVGVAWGTTIPALVFNVVVTPAVTCRAIGVSVVDYWWETMPRPLVVAAVAGAAVFATVSHLPVANGWLAIFWHAAIVGTEVGGGVFMGMSSADRATILVGPAQRALALVRRRDRVVAEPAA